MTDFPDKLIAHETLIARLDDPDDAFDLVKRAFDFYIDQPVSTYVDPQRVLAFVDLALDERLTEPYVRKHLRGFIQREKARTEIRGDRFRDWMSPEAHAELRALAAKPVRIDRKRVDRFVYGDGVRDLMRSVIEDTLDRFVKTLKSSGASGGGVAGAVGRGAFGFAKGVRKSVLGGIGQQIEAQLQRAIGGFLDGSMSFVLERLAARLASEETARRVSRVKLKAFDNGVERRTSELWSRIDDETMDALVEIVPGWLTHNLRREDVRAGFLDEVRAFLELEAEVTVRTWIDQCDAMPFWHEELRRISAPLLGAFARTDAFREWLVRAKPAE